MTHTKIKLNIEGLYHQNRHPHSLNQNNSSQTEQSEPNWNNPNQNWDIRLVKRVIDLVWYKHEN